MKCLIPLFGLLGCNNVNDTGNENIGTFRLYFSADYFATEIDSGDEKPDVIKSVLRSAISSNGLDFVIERNVWGDTLNIDDPAIRYDTKWRFVSGTNKDNDMEKMIRYTSSDSFHFEEPISIGIKGFSPDIFTFPEGNRIYYTNNYANGIYSLLEENPTFKKEEGTRIKASTELPFVADPTVERRNDSTYVMYFKGSISTREPETHALYRATSQDGFNWEIEGTPILTPFELPSVTTDTNGRVLICGLHSKDGQNYDIYTAFENDDYSLPEFQKINLDNPNNFSMGDPGIVSLETIIPQSF